MYVMLKLGYKSYIALGVIGLNVAALTLPFATEADTQTTNTTVNLTINPVIISYSSGPTVTLGAINPTVTGRQSIASDTVAASTNDSAGLTITMEENGGVSTDMTSGGNSIPTSADTPAVPVALSNNRWGWRIDSLSGFGAGPTGAISSAAPSSLTFAGIPANASPYTIETTNTNGSTSKTVWYSARVDTTQPTGAYSVTVKYTISTN